MIISLYRVLAPKENFLPVPEGIVLSIAGHQIIPLAALVFFGADLEAAAQVKPGIDTDRSAKDESKPVKPLPGDIIADIADGNQAVAVLQPLYLVPGHGIADGEGQVGLLHGSGDDRGRVEVQAAQIDDFRFHDDTSFRCFLPLLYAAFTQHIQGIRCRCRRQH